MVNLVEIYEPKNTKHVALEEVEPDFPSYAEWQASEEITQRYTIIEEKVVLSYFDKR